MDEEYAWAKAHPWSSWRERYKKNAARFDAMIEEAIPKMNPRRQHNWPAARDVQIRFRSKKVVEISDESSQSEEEDQQRQSSSRGSEPPQKRSHKQATRSVAFAPVEDEEGAGPSRRASFEEPPAKRQRVNSDGHDHRSPTKSARRRPLSEDEEVEDEGEHKCAFVLPFSMARRLTIRLQLSIQWFR